MKSEKLKERSFHRYKVEIQGKKNSKTHKIYAKTERNKGCRLQY